jgi:ABC-type transport system involved in multi-copper enzyme maturation permease subunit
MIWLTWRQFRASALVLLGAVAAGLAVLAVTGPQVADLSRSTGQGFLEALGADRLKSTVFYASTAVVYVLPALVGIFWGAPMVSRELEAGTSRLVWTQSITRTRWLATKLGVAGVGAAAVGSFGLFLTWWCGPLDDAVANGYGSNGLYGEPRLWPSLFGTRGIVPIGTVVLALVIGVTLGLLIRRAVPAMAATLVAVVAVQVLMPLVVQAHLLPGSELTAKITQGNLAEVRAVGDVGPDADDVIIDQLGISAGSPDAWITANVTRDASGKVVDRYPAWVTDCAPPPGAASTDESVDACFTRLADEGYRQRVEYLPASKFWPLQLAETGVLLALAGLLTGFCFWRIRRDLT